MGGKGFPPAPTALKAIRGNPGRRPLNRREPQPAKDVRYPEAPAHLTPAAREEWTKIVPELAACGLLTRIDHVALAEYCATWGRVLEAEAELTKGLRIMKKSKKTGESYPVLNPYFSLLVTLLGQLKGFLGEFGMTPASRSRIQVDKPVPVSDVDQFKRKHG
jgi:P27 family predicted phage terminase small subunit